MPIRSRTAAHGTRVSWAVARRSTAAEIASSEVTAPILEPVTVLRHERPLRPPLCPRRWTWSSWVPERAGMSRRAGRREAGPGHRPAREERLLRRLDRPQRRRRLDPGQLRPQGGRPGLRRRHGPVQALPRLDRRRRRAEGPPRHLPRPRPRGHGLRQGQHPAAVRVGAASTPTTTPRRPAAGPPAAPASRSRWTPASSATSSSGCTRSTPRRRPT